MLSRILMTDRYENANDELCEGPCPRGEKDAELRKRCIPIPFFHVIFFNFLT